MKVQHLNNSNNTSHTKLIEEMWTAEKTALKTPKEYVFGFASKQKQVALLVYG